MTEAAETGTERRGRRAGCWLLALLLLLTGAELVSGLLSGEFHFSRVGITDTWETNPVGYIITAGILAAVTGALGLMVLMAVVERWLGAEAEGAEAGAADDVGDADTEADAGSMSDPDDEADPTA